MITSNIESVIGRLKKAQGKLPAKVKEAAKPDRYRGHFAALAKLSLEAAAESDAERDAIPVMLANMTVNEAPNGMQVSMKSTSMDAINSMDGWLTELSKVDRDTIEKWVTEHKVITSKDRTKGGVDKGADVIASRVIHAIKENPDPWFATDKEGEGALNPEGLAQVAGLVNLPVEKVRQMLAVVLNSWSQFSREMVPATVAAKMRSAFK